MYQKPSIGSRLNYGHPLAKGLVGCWLFNEMSGDMVFDYSGMSKHGTIIGVAAQSLTSGWNPGSLCLDGANDLISFPKLLPEPPYTIVSIINPVDCGLTNYANGILYQGSGSNDAGTTFAIANNTGVPNVIQFANQGGSWVISAANKITPGMNQQVAVALSKAGVANLYVSGILVKTGSSGTGTPSNYVTRSGFWYNTTDANRYYEGKIHYLLVYNRDLSGIEIAYLDAFPYCMFERQFPSYWLAEEEEPPGPSGFTPRITMIM